MENIFKTTVIAAAAVVLWCGGCHTATPYEHRDGWIYRDNDIPQYAADFDLVYLTEPRIDGYQFDEKESMIRLFDYVKKGIAKPFGHKVRVFAPLIRKEREVLDAAEAIRYYRRHFCDRGRFFLVLINGRDPSFELALRQELGEVLKPADGFLLMHCETVLPDGKQLARRAYAAQNRRRTQLIWCVDPDQLLEETF